MRKLHLTFLLAFSIFILNAQNDVPLNPNLTWNGEISLAINPLNQANFVTAWMKLTSIKTVSIAIIHSSDGGNTWSAPVYMPHFSSAYTSADPTLIVSANGTFYFAYIDFNNTIYAAGGVYVTRSNDGGQTWTTPVLAIDASASPDVPIDRPWLAIDDSKGPYRGTLYMVTKSIKEATTTHHIYLLRSTDSGITWSIPRVLDDVLPVGGTSNIMGVPCVTSGGALYVNYFSYDISQDYHVRDVFVRSGDGGQTFTDGIISELPFASAIPPSDSLYQYSYHLAANPSDSNNLIHVFTDRRDGDWDIWFNYTLDGGETWSVSTRLNDDVVGNGIGQDFCWGGFSSNGIYTALWRDRRDGTAGPLSDYRIYGASSVDKGAVFGSNFPLSKTLAALSVPTTGNDFLGVCLTDSLVYGAWADKRSGINQEYLNFHALPSLFGIREITRNTQPRIIPSVIYSSYCDINPVYIEKCQSFQVQIFDLPGRILIQQSNKSRLELGSLPRGMYIIGLITRNVKFYQRFIKE